jgi:2-polyprenyl-3-methyl-5-hydroxy-6-metoxy-1,4-benzoquinol methylase
MSESVDKIAKLETQLAKDKEEFRKSIDWLKAVSADQSKQIEELKSSFNRVNARMLLPPHLIQGGKDDEFESLKLLLESDAWPHAVDPSLICDITVEKDKEDRAEGIIDLIIETNLAGLSFLDFGCGDGHVVEKSKEQKTKLSVGYDTKKSEKWNDWKTDEKSLFTTNWEEVKAKGPYNVILMYDVIDHIQGDDNAVIEELKKVRSVTAPGAKVYVRCHPWCSRHGTHLYHQKNKAFMHLIFTDEELNKLGYEQEKTQKVIHPVATYQNWFRAAGFQIPRNHNAINEHVEPFFLETPLLAKRIKSNWAHSHDHKLRIGHAFPDGQVKQQFLDFILI